MSGEHKTIVIDGPDVPWPHRPACSCGWVGAGWGTWSAAKAEGDKHTKEPTR